MKTTKKGALELSIGTVVVLVLGITMLILGMVVTRSIMCSALGLTGDVNTKVRAELNSLFDSTEGEVVCIGGGSDAIKIVPGKENIAWCSIKAPEKADYTITVTDYGTSIPGLTKDTLKQWITVNSWQGTVAPGDTSPKKAVHITLPGNAPEGNIRLQLQVTKNGQLINTPELDFDITRVGFVQTAIC